MGNGDDNDDTWTAATIGGTYGSLTIDAVGAWTYTLNDADTDTNVLDDGDAPVDTITVSTTGGTTHDIDVTVRGPNRHLDRQ